MIICDDGQAVFYPEGHKLIQVHKHNTAVRFFQLLLIIRCPIYRVLLQYLLGGDLMIKKRLGNRIRELRQNTGLSQEKFALKIGMDRTYFASVEAGKRNIAIVNLEKIANGLEVSLSELFKAV